MNLTERLRRLRPLHAGLLIPWVVVAIASLQPIRDNSFLWHVTAGRVQAASGTVLVTDPFSFTRGGEAWRTQSWLIELAYHWIDTTFGLAFTSVLLALCAVVMFVAVMLRIWQSTGSLVSVVVWTGLTAWVAAMFLNPRPVIASYALLALVVLVAEYRKLSWTLPLIAWIWASIHASFILGIAYVGLGWMRRRNTRPLVDAIAMTVATWFTAHGTGMMDFLVGFVGNRDALEFLTEWSRPDFLSIGLSPVLILLLALASRRDGRSFGQLIVMAFGLVLMVSASRSVLPAWLILVPLAATSTVSWDKAMGAHADRSLIPAVLGFILLLGPLLLPLRPRLDEARFAVPVIEAADPDLRTFHDDVVGGYLIYAQWPTWKVFVDDRAELYGAEFFQEVLETRNGTPTWRDVFTDADIEQVIIRQNDQLVEVLLDEGWRFAYEDEDWGVLRPAASS